MAEAVNTASSQDSRYVSDAEEILRTLKILRDRRSLLSLRFDGEAQSYSANVLDINSNYLILEDIRPRNGIQFAREARPFTVSARAEGLYAYFTDCVVEAIESERGVPYFLTSLPRNILCQQRRKSARFRLPLAVAASGATIRLHRGSESLAGDIIDISAGGCRASFRTHPKPEFGEAETANCDIEIPKLLEVGAKAVIRHHNQEDDTVICGIELQEMVVSDRRRLEQFVQKIAKTTQKA